MTMFGSQWLANPGVTYEIDQSIRFNDDDSAHLSRTLGTATNRKIWTYSLWLKRATLGTRQMFFTVAAGGGAQGIIEFDQGDGGTGGMDKLIVNSETSGTTTLNWELEIAFRDPAAWYHFVFVYDTTQSTTNDRFKCFVNGALQTEWDRNSTPGLNEEQAFNNALDHRIGEGHTAANYFDGYMAEIHFIDGTAKAASDFGEYNSETGQWVPIEYTGSYGNNGFYLKGQDSSALGDDTSGNGNDFASSGLAAADQMSDSPTLNYPVINPLDYQTGSNVTISDGNLTFKNANSGSANDARATFAVSSGKWYWEVEADTLGQSGVNREFIGIVSPEFAIASGSGGSNFSQDASGYAFATTGQKINNNSAASYGSAFSVGQYIGVALDLDNGKIYWSINGTFQASGDPAAGSNAAYTGISGTFAPAFAVDYGTGNSTLIANFGASAFQNSPPTGFKALNTANLPSPSISDPSAYFQATTYAGNGSTQSITNTGNSNLQGDLIWIKNRSAADSHVLTDSVRGATKIISSNNRDAETTDADTVTAFNSDGFALGADDKVNTSSENYIAWQWKESSTPGFDIVTYTGTGSGANISHNLGVKPSVVLIKCRSDGSTHWIVNDWSGDYANKLKLNENEAASGSSGFITAATSSNFTLGTDSDVNGSSRTYVAYCFAEVEGFSKFGSYTGNGNADGPFVATGFAPSVIIFKNASAAYNWDIRDSKRDPLNPNTFYLSPSLNDAEATSSDGVDFLSNGFKYRSSGATANGSGNTIIYMAFAKTPFKTANAR